MKSLLSLFESSAASQLRDKERTIVLMQQSIDAIKANAPPPLTDEQKKEHESQVACWQELNVVLLKHGYKIGVSNVNIDLVR